MHRRRGHIFANTLDLAGRLPKAAYKLRTLMKWSIVGDKNLRLALMFDIVSMKGHAETAVSGWLEVDQLVHLSTVPKVAS